MGACQKIFVPSCCCTTFAEKRVRLSLYIRQVIFLAVILLGANRAWCQITLEKRKSVVMESDSVLLDSAVVLPSSLSIFVRNEALSPEKYTLHLSTGTVSFRPSLKGDTLLFVYKTLPNSILPVYRSKPIGLIRQQGADAFSPYYVGGEKAISDLPGQGGLNKSGSISRGVAFGNAQNLSVNSALNLQMSGYITERVQLMASVTDDNIPIQPQGNTQQLQDFDQVFIQLFDKKNKLIAGDFVLRKPQGYFLNYFKRAQGIYFEHNSDVSKTPGFSRVLRAEASASISKGRFARNVIQGVEGNQGPYRLTGEDNEAFIIVLAGTEAVYIDGRLLERGQDKDYVIDYNAAEIVFTPRQFITKDRRITVEFQYSDKRYARPMFQASVSSKTTTTEMYLNLYSESDAKNQPLQQELTDDARRILNGAGDDFLSATLSGFDSVGFANNAVLYALVDSLGYDSVWRYSEDPAVAAYRVSFSKVGLGRGDYVEDGFTANGRRFRWVAPVEENGVLRRQGDHAPIILLSAPKKRQMITAGVRHSKALASKPNVRYEWWLEGAASVNDQNTFSSADADDDLGFAQKWGVARTKTKEKQAETKTFSGAVKREWRALAAYEYTSIFFNRIERFREVEFERNWNTAQLNMNNDQHLMSAEISSSDNRIGKWMLGAEGFVIGENFTGWKGKAQTQLDTKNGWRAFSTASATQTSGQLRSQFIRHKSDISKRWGNFKLGFRDEHEWNTFYIGNSDSLAANTYQFYDWEINAGTADTTKSRFSVFYRNRRDLKPDINALSGVAAADEYGGMFSTVFSNKDRLSFTVSNRRLRVLDAERFLDQPENTLITRTEYSFGWWKNAVQGNLFYEVSSGLEQQREFIYLEVPAGQGTFIWNDYDGDGIKDLNEFEVAQFAYEANFIRSFIQSDSYIKTYKNQYSQSLQLQPARYWKNPESKGLKLLTLFSNQTSYKVDRKTTREDNWNRLNPFFSAVEDSALLAINGSFRQALFFKKTDPKFGMDHQYQELRNKLLLSNGFEARADKSHQLSLRWNAVGALTVFVEQRIGTREVKSNFLGGRNFEIAYSTTRPRLTWQPDPSKRFSLLAEYTDKKNRIGPEQAVITRGGVETALNSSEKGVFQMTFDYYLIRYNGEGNNSLAFEMLEGLTEGSNWVWSAGVQRTVAKNLQLNLTYNGRKPDGLRTIHSGGVQVRAFF
jgi:hypothetical protein